MTESNPKLQNKAEDDELVMSLVELALARPPEDREHYVHSACARDSQLFEEVWKYVQAEERLNGFLLDPLYPPPAIEHPFESGDLLDGRFRIVRQVAEGGMGIVYEAMDEKLDRRIAIKCAKTGFRKRLPPEVRHATGIAHPNVCKIYEIHEAATDQGEIEFLTMELLEGETLTERLRRGLPPESEARTIARQLCAGLAEAHRNHIIHGDLKSNNVILTTGADGSLRAVITDFGLAHRPETSCQSIQSGVLGGTPDYMAPELWKGAKASVASDVYAFGVLLYELASGRKPFPFSGGASWEERLTRKPGPVNQKWDYVLKRCLDPDPANRSRNAQELEMALAPRSRRWILAPAAAVVLAVGTGLATYRSTVVPPETVRLAILPFETSASDKPLGDGLLGQTEAQLRRIKSSGTRRLTIIPLDAAAQNKLDSPAKAVKLLGATHVLYGTLRRQGERALIHAYLTDAHSEVPLKNWQAGYSPNELQDAPVSLAGLVTGTLRLPPLALAVGVNAAAFADYTKAVGLLQRNNTDEAIPLLEKAAKADPESPLTHARLAEAQMVNYSATNDVRWLEQAILSLGNARQRNPDVAEVWLVSAMINQYRGLYEPAEVDLHRAVEIEPQNGDVWRRLGQVLQKNSRFGEALAAYRKAIDLQPSYFKNHQVLCEHFTEEMNYEDAVGECTKMVALAPDLSESYYARAGSYFNWQHYPEAENDLRAALRLDARSSKAIILLASTLAYEQQYQDAIPLFERALEIGPETYVLDLALGQTYRWANLPDQATAAYAKGVVLAKLNLARNSRDAIVQARLAYMLARLGERMQAQSEAVLALQAQPTVAEVVRWVVMAYVALEEYDRALVAAESAPNDALRRLNRSPDMAGFRVNPRFQQLMRSRHIK